MQALHEMCERRSETARPRTEAQQLREAELTILRGHVTASQRRIQELQEKYQRAATNEELAKRFTPYSGPPPVSEEEKERRFLAKTEDQIMGIPDPVTKRNIDAMKMAADAEAPPSGKSEEVNRKARAFQLATGRTPTAQEIQKWMGSKH